MESKEFRELKGNIRGCEIFFKPEDLKNNISKEDFIRSRLEGEFLKVYNEEKEGLVTEINEFKDSERVEYKTHYIIVEYKE